MAPLTSTIPKTGPDSGTANPRESCRSPRKIRVLCFRDTESVCGPGKTIINTCRTIDKDRFSMAVAVPVNGQATNVFLDRARQIGAETLTVKVTRRFDPIAVFRLVRLLRRYGIQILQTHDAQTRRLGAIAALLVGAVHVTSLHGWITNSRKEKLSALLDRWLTRFSSRVIVVSQRLREQVEASGVAASRITLLQNGVLLDDYPLGGSSDGIRTEFGFRRHDKVVGIVGRLSPEKGHRIFLEMASLVRARRSDVKFLIVGDGPLMADLKTQARELGLVGDVVFTGHRTDMLDVYAGLDVVALSSFTEGHPNALLEAFACCKPVAATRVGGVPELVIEGQTGFMVEPGDAPALAERVLRLIDDDRLAATMGRNGRRLVESQFSFRERTRRLERLYEACLSRRTDIAAAP